MKYTEAGVDTYKADKFVESIGINPDDFGALIKLGRDELVFCTDGVGTKILMAEELNKFDTIGIDLVAMCVNDLLCKGARPIAFLDYYATGKLDLDKSNEIMKGIKKGCEIAGCDLVGGETAELPGMYDGNKFDLAGFAVGLVQRRNGMTRPESFPKKYDIVEGDLLIGIPSSGIHSNGFSLIRKHMKPSIELLEPTRIYVKEVMDVCWDIKACAHITGGGLNKNIDRVIPKDLTYCLDFVYSDFWHDIFEYCGFEDDITHLIQFEEVFNCGWGMVLVASQDKIDSIKSKIPDCEVLGVLECV